MHRQTQNKTFTHLIQLGKIVLYSIGGPFASKHTFRGVLSDARPFCYVRVAWIISKIIFGWCILVTNLCFFIVYESQATLPNICL